MEEECPMSDAPLIGWRIGALRLASSPWDVYSPQSLGRFHLCRHFESARPAGILRVTSVIIKWFRGRSASVWRFICPGWSSLWMRAYFSSTLCRLRGNYDFIDVRFYRGDRLGQDARDRHLVRLLWQRRDEPNPDLASDPRRRPASRLDSIYGSRANVSPEIDRKFFRGHRALARVNLPP